MTADEIRTLLESELRSFSPRDDREDLFRHLLRKASRLMLTDPDAVEGALRSWIEQDDDPERLMFAVNLASQLNISGLRPDIASLLNEVREGKVLKPIYEELIVVALARIRVA